MAIIESVAMRQRGGLDFEMHYDNLCALNGLCPLPAVKAHLRQNKLDLNGDRIKANDWVPILNTIKINKTLEHIAIRSFYQQEVEEKELVRTSARRLKVPIIRCKELTNRVCRALRECLAVNPVLQIIELEGLPLRPKDTEALAKGIVKTKHLRHLSLENTCIGDDQLTVLCRVIKNTMSITSVNFSGCSLTWRSAEMIADVIKHQGTMRHTEAWQDSLRYRRPDLDRMAGLRRITANCNPLIGDKGAAALADVLRDDLWVKAVDLHQCGIGDVGGKALIEILKINTTLVVMDVRLNPLISQETMASLNDQVFLNSASCESEFQYKWLKINQEQKTPAKNKQYRSKKRTKVLQGYGRKSTVVRASSSYLQKRVKSAPSSECRSFEPVCTDYMKPGTPWRTALRAAQHRGEIPDRSAAKVNLYESVSEMSNPLDQSDFTDAANYSQIREIKVELEMLQRSAADESMAKRNLERKVQQLTSENGQLRQELKELQAKRSLLDNDQILDCIEQSFRQFHSFLDLLRDVGLGQLIAMAGLDQASMPFQTDSARPLEKDRSRLDTTRQMRSFLEQSRLDASELSFMSDAQPLDQDSSYCRSSIFRNRSSDAFHGVVPNSKSSLNFSSHNNPLFEDGKSRKTTSKFDELYQKALKNTETILQRKEFLPPRDASTESGRRGVQKPYVNGQSTEVSAVGGFANGAGREVEGASSEITAGILRDSEKAGTSDNQYSDRSESVSLSAGRKRDASNKSEPRSSQDSAAKLSLNFQRSGQPTVSDAVLEQKVLSDRSEKSALSYGGTSPKLAATMSDLQDNRQTGEINFNESCANESFDTVDDEQIISEESEIEELLELNDSEVRGGADGAL